MGFFDKKKNDKICLDNGKLKCNILTYGQRIQSLYVQDKNGNPVNVVIGFDSVRDYKTKNRSVGATIGRFANRIRNGRFLLKGKEVQLTKNRDGHHIHGGRNGFSSKYWDVDQVSEKSVQLSYKSKDGEEGFPGNFDIAVKFELIDNSLKISYNAVSDQDTICNLTNHSYFNLQGKGSVYNQKVRIFQSKYTPVDEEKLPLGTIEDVSGKMDLREYTPVPEDFTYDHNYILDSKGKCAECFCDETGIKMIVETDMPAMQFFTGKKNGICFETQFPPDFPNNPNFPSCFLKKGEHFESYTIFKFEILE